MTESLRERKKARTRAEIGRQALRLFGERGFDHTTTAQIAAAAEVAPATFFGYFATKEDAALHGVADTLARLGATIRDRPAGTDTITAFTGGLAAEGDRTDAEPAIAGVALSADVPRVEARLLQLIRGFERDVLAPALATDLHCTATDPRVRLVAASLSAMLDQWQESTDDPAADTDLLPLITTFVTAGLTALRTPDPAA